jgi:outer membrane protein assembly factor BamB
MRTGAFRALLFAGIGLGALAACTLLVDTDELAGEPALPDAGGAGDAAGDTGPRTCNAPGLQLEAPWPTVGGCVSRTSRSAFVGTSSSSRKWSLAASSEPNWYVAHSGPFIDRDGNIYFGDDTGLVAVNPDGTLRWRASIGDVSYGFAIAADGTIIVSANSRDSALFAIRPDGTVRWSRKIGQDDLVPAIDDDGTIYFGADRNRANALDPEGNPKWFAETDAAAYRVSISPQGLVVFTTRDDHGVHAIRRDGGRVWDGTVARAQDLAVGDDGLSYVSADDGLLHALGTNGSIRWTLRPDAASQNDAREIAIGTDGTVYFGAGDGVRALTPAGMQRWLFPTSRPAGGVSVDADGNVYFCIGDATAGEVVSLHPDGALRWRHAMPSTCTRGQPAIGKDGTVYAVAAIQSTLVAIGP